MRFTLLDAEGMAHLRAMEAASRAAAGEAS
jgi:hypothetical protein